MPQGQEKVPRQKCWQRNTIFHIFQHWRSQHHLPKANIIQKTHLCLGRQKCVFVGWGTGIRVSSRRRKAEIISALLRSSVSRGSDSPQGCHSLPLPFESLHCNPAKRRGSTMCYLFFLAGAQGFEPRKCQSQSLMPYRLAMPQYSTDDIIPRAVMFVKSFFEKSWKIS